MRNQGKRARKKTGARYSLTRSRKEVEAQLRPIADARLEIVKRDGPENERRSDDQRLQVTLETIPGMVWTMLSDGTVDFCSQSILGYCGKTLDELQDLTCVWHPDEIKGKARQLRHFLSAGTPNQDEFRLRRHDGVYRWHQCRVRPLRNEAGQIVRWYGLLWDIDDRKQNEIRLRRSETQLQEAQRLTHTGSWTRDTSSGKVTGTPEVYRIHAVQPNEDGSRPELYFNRIHPDHVERIRKLYERSESQKTEYRAEYPIIVPDGSVKHIRAIGRPIFNEAGDYVEFGGTVMDITEEVQSRADLEKAFAEIKVLKDQLYRENLALRDEVDRVSMFEEIVGTSKALKSVLSSVVMVAPTDSTVLITGETGTGKELIARAIHKRSRRSERAFVSVNCAALAPSLISSELFGHEKGAFTGALQRRLGRFEMANGGTIFLDEIGELPGETQIALLRVLQERTFERVGSNYAIPTDVRVIAATNRNLQKAIAGGEFRRDLFYRLNVFPIELPPLRQRKEDISILVEYFVNRYAEKSGKHFSKIDIETIQLCESYPWPGNIRELQNIIERAVILCNGEMFRIEETWLSNQDGLNTQAPAALPDALLNQEKEIIKAALAASNGKIAGPDGAAAKLGIPRSTLDSKIKQLGISKYRVVSVRQ